MQLDVYTHRTVENGGGLPILRFATGMSNGIHVLSIGGEVDYSAKDAFEKALSSAVEGAHSPLIIDLSDVRYMDSTGLNSLARAKSRMSARGDELYIVLPQKHLQKIFAILGFDRLFHVHKTLDEAVAAAQG